MRRRVLAGENCNHYNAWTFQVSADAVWIKKNRGQCSQRNVHQLLKDLPFATFIYMDDLIVGSVNKEQHLLDLRCLFQRLKDKGRLLNRKKCELGRAYLTFLGHVINADGNSIPSERVEAITRFPVPKTPKEFERFLGVCLLSSFCATRVS